MYIGIVLVMYNVIMQYTIFYMWSHLSVVYLSFHIESPASWSQLIAKVLLEYIRTNKWCKITQVSEVPTISPMSQ